MNYDVTFSRKPKTNPCTFVESGHDRAHAMYKAWKRSGGRAFPIVKIEFNTVSPTYMRFHVDGVVVDVFTKDNV